MTEVAQPQRSESEVVCGDGFPGDACILAPKHDGLHERIPVVTTGEVLAYGIDKVTYGDVVNGKARYVPFDEANRPGSPPLPPGTKLPVTKPTPAVKSTVAKP